MKKNLPEFRYRAALLIDDNELDNFINQKTMEAHSFARKIYVATNGKSAIDFIKNLLVLDPELFPEVILIDLNMPLMDGFQFIEYCQNDASIKSRKPRLAVLTSSVNARDKERIAMYSDEIVYLNKPLNPRMLESL